METTMIHKTLTFKEVEPKKWFLYDGTLHYKASIKMDDKSFNALRYDEQWVNIEDGETVETMTKIKDHSYAHV